jgi:hypothetical protein
VTNSAGVDEYVIARPNLIETLVIDLALNVEGSVDYWYDDGFLESRRRLRLLCDDEWEELKRLWPNQVVEWQERLACILGAEGAVREIELLLDMFTKDASLVSLDAADALRSIAFEPLLRAVRSIWAAHGWRVEDLSDLRSVNELLNMLRAEMITVSGSG